MSISIPLSLQAVVHSITAHCSFPRLPLFLYRRHTLMPECTPVACSNIQSEILSLISCILFKNWPINIINIYELRLSPCSTRVRISNSPDLAAPILIEKHSNIKFLENSSSGSRVESCGRRNTDRRTNREI